MSPEMKRALEAATLCSKALSDLKHQATAGDLAALLVLADVATEAALALEETWSAPGTYNPFQHAKLTSAREIRREAMSFWLRGKSMLPILHAIDGEPSAEGLAMLDGIRSGPFKARRRKATDIQTFLEAMVIPFFQDVQARPSRPGALEGKIWDLPPLTSANAAAWAAVIVEWLQVRHHSRLTDPQSWLYRTRTLHIHSSLVIGSGENRSTLTASADFTRILTDFAPRSKRRTDLTGVADSAPQVDLLIASDCISEGQNLQDCDTVINYDIHWNPVRIIQRFGRIDRIGSRANEVRLVNFWPTAHLDRYINLKQRVEARMALVDLTATQTDNPLDEKQLEDLVTTDLRLRDRQLERMRKEILDLEDLEDSVTLADFSLDDFRADLLRFLEKNREQLEKAPLGLYAVVPARPDFPLTAGGGVIFCLRQKGDAIKRPVTETEKVNPLSPHYLVYVRADGDVRLAYTQVKTILNLFRELTLGHAEPYTELCRLFDRATANGSDMGAQSRLIASAVQSITATFQQKLAHGLQASRQFVLPVAADQPTDDEAELDLVTWLVLHPSV